MQRSWLLYLFVEELLLPALLSVFFFSEIKALTPTPESILFIAGFSSDGELFLFLTLRAPQRKSPVFSFFPLRNFLSCLSSSRKSSPAETRRFPLRPASSELPYVLVPVEFVACSLIPFFLP